MSIRSVGLTWLRSLEVQTLGTAGLFVNNGRVYQQFANDCLGGLTSGTTRIPSPPLDMAYTTRRSKSRSRTDSSSLPATFPAASLTSKSSGSTGYSSYTGRTPSTSLPINEKNTGNVTTDYVVLAFAQSQYRMNPITPTRASLGSQDSTGSVLGRTWLWS